MTDRIDTAQERRTDRRRIAAIAAVAGAILLGAAMVTAALAADGPGTGGSDGIAGALATLTNTTGTDGSAGTWGPGPGPDGGRGFGPGGMGDRLGGPGGHLADAATALGMTTDELLTELRSGKTIAAVAEAKGVALGTVTKALVDAEKQEIADAVTAGRLTQAQADQLLANVEQHATDIVNGTVPRPMDGMGPGADCSGGTGPGPMGLGRDTGDELAAAATALGLTTTELQTKLQAGSSLAEIATAEKVAVQTVIDALVTVEKAEIDAALTAGAITQAQADRMKANVTQRATDIVNGTFRGGPGGRGHGGRGHGGRGHGDGGFGPGVGPGFGPGATDDSSNSGTGTSWNG